MSELRAAKTNEERRHVERVGALWEALENVPTGQEGKRIETPFLHFVEGRKVEEIKRWFESGLGVSTACLTGAADEPICERQLDRRALRQGRRYGVEGEGRGKAGKWVHCSPRLVSLGIRCRRTLRKPCDCGKRGSHDHFVSDPEVLRALYADPSGSSVSA